MTSIPLFSSLCLSSSEIPESVITTSILEIGAINANRLLANFLESVTTIIFLAISIMI